MTQEQRSGRNPRPGDKCGMDSGHNMKQGRDRHINTNLPKATDRLLPPRMMGIVYLHHGVLFSLVAAARGRPRQRLAQGARAESGAIDRHCTACACCPLPAAHEDVGGTAATTQIQCRSCKERDVVAKHGGRCPHEGGQRAGSGRDGGESARVRAQRAGGSTWVIVRLAA